MVPIEGSRGGEVLDGKDEPSLLRSAQVGPARHGNAPFERPMYSLRAVVLAGGRRDEPYLIGFPDPPAWLVSPDPRENYDIEASAFALPMDR